MSGINVKIAKRTVGMHGPEAEKVNLKQPVEKPDSGPSVEEIRASIENKRKLIKLLEGYVNKDQLVPLEERADSLLAELDSIIGSSKEV